MLDLSWQDNHITRLKYAIWMPTIYNWIFWMVLSLSLAEDITLLCWIRLGLTIKSVSSHTIVCIPNQREEFWEYWVEDFFSDESCKRNKHFKARLTWALNRIFKMWTVSIPKQFYLLGIQFWSLYKFFWSLRYWTLNYHISKSTIHNIHIDIHKFKSSQKRFMIVLGQ